MAVDEGVLVKTGPDVLVSVRRALGGTDLGQLREAVEHEFLTLDEHEQSVRSVLAKMEGDLIRRMASLHMTDEPQDKLVKPKPSLSQEVGAKAARKLKARRNAGQGVWFGLGMMGLIGWSVVIPTLLGAALGIWLDQHYPGKHRLDAGAVDGRARHRLFECMALGGQGRQGDAGRTGG